MQLGNCVIRDVHLIGAKMHRAEVALLEVAAIQIATEMSERYRSVEAKTLNSLSSLTSTLLVGVFASETPTKAVMAKNINAQKMAGALNFSTARCLTGTGSILQTPHE